MLHKVVTVSVVAVIVATATLPRAAEAQIQPYSDSCQDLRDAGDVLRYALPLSALALTWGYEDKEGAFQYIRQLAATGAATGTFKAIGDKTRPDANTSRQSFVSGHVSSSFSGASFIYTRYGKGWGVPAYLLAGATAYSRVCASKHFADDALGGALVAMMANWYFTSPHPSNTKIYPSFTSNGLEIAWSSFFGGNRHPVDPVNFDPRYRVVFEFGPLYQEKNLVQTPVPQGTLIDLEALEEEFHMTARLIYDRYFTDRHTFSFWYGPMGMTEFGEPTQPFVVGSEIFDPADPNAALFDSNYRWFDARGTYKYTVVDNERFWFKVGVGLQYSATEFEVEQRNDAGDIVKRGSGEDSSFAPTAHLSAAVRFSDRWSLEAEVDGMEYGDEHYWNNAIWLRYRPTQIWDLAVGGRQFSGKVSTTDFFNEIEFTDFTFQVGRSF